MVYVLCRIVGQLEPTRMINLQSADEPGRTSFVQQVLAAFGRMANDDVDRVNIYFASGGLYDFDVPVPLPQGTYPAKSHHNICLHALPVWET